MITLFSIGFTQKNAQEFYELLGKCQIDCLIDVRLNPNGQLSRFAFGKDLPFFLNKLVEGCQYVHRPDLAPQSELLKEVRTKGAPMNKDYSLFEKVFNEYLDTESGIANFIQDFGEYERVVFLCSEHTTEKCHRRLLCEMLLKMFPNQVQLGKHLL